MSEQRTLSLGFREFRSSSYERLVEIYNANYPDYPISVAERRSRDESLDRTKYLLRRFECLDRELDRIVGFGELMNLPDMYHPGKFAGYIDKALKEGITFTTLAEEQPHGEGSLRKVHELVQLITADMPREAAFTPLKYEQWETFSLKNPQMVPDSYIIARDGPKYVGISNVHRIDTEPGVLHQDDTGVTREYRGRGIATALKLKVIEYTKKNGYRMIKTWNDSDNWPMLAVNTKLGFKRQVGWITMEKILRSGASG